MSVVTVSAAAYKKLKSKEAAQVVEEFHWECPNPDCGVGNCEYEEPFGQLVVVECFKCKQKFTVE